MFRKFALAVELTIALPALAAAQTASEPATTTSTGWFSDRGCAAPRVKRGDISPNNPDCAKKCLDDGAVAVFISEQAKALFEVKDYQAVKDDVGYRVEVTGIVDEEAKTIAVKSVKAPRGGSYYVRPAEEEGDALTAASAAWRAGSRRMRQHVSA